MLAFFPERKVKKPARPVGCVAVKINILTRHSSSFSELHKRRNKTHASQAYWGFAAYGGMEFKMNPVRHSAEDVAQRHPDPVVVVLDTYRSRYLFVSSRSFPMHTHTLS